MSEEEKSVDVPVATSDTWELVDNIEQIVEGTYEEQTESNIPLFLGDQNRCRNLNHMSRSPIEFFGKLFTGKMMEHIVTTTNEFARHSGETAWVNITVEELKCFFSIILYMGVVKLGSKEDYWRHDTRKQVFVYSRMRFSRFNAIVKCMHYEDTSLLSQEERQRRNADDPFWTITGLCDLLSKHCSEYWSLGQFISLDETCIPFTGRHKAKQYNPKKPHKWHFKQYSMNDAATGYLFSFFLYRGKSEKRPDR